MENSLTQRLQFTMRMVYIVLILVLMEYSLTNAQTFSKNAGLWS